MDVLDASTVQLHQEWALGRDTSRTRFQESISCFPKPGVMQQGFAPLEVWVDSCRIVLTYRSLKAIATPHSLLWPQVCERVSRATSAREFVA